MELKKKDMNEELRYYVGSYRSYSFSEPIIFIFNKSGIIMFQYHGSEIVIKCSIESFDERMDAITVKCFTHFNEGIFAAWDDDNDLEEIPIQIWIDSTENDPLHDGLDNCNYITKQDVPMYYHTYEKLCEKSDKYYIGYFHTRFG